MRKVNIHQIGLLASIVDRLPAPLRALRSWHHRHFCLQERIETMSVLAVGIVCNCSHDHLRSGFFDPTGFRYDDGDDVRCVDCGQLWVATQETDHFMRYGSSAHRHDMRAARWAASQNSPSAETRGVRP